MSEETEGKFPRDFVLNGVDIKSPGLKLGAGTRVEFGKFSSREMERQPALGIGDVDLLVTVQVKLSFKVCIATNGPYTRCEICDTPAPMPDDEALMFLLRNHDLGRIAWPYPEDAEEERDRYPVAGWQKHRDEDGEPGLVCPGCVVELRKARQALKARRRTK